MSKSLTVEKLAEMTIFEENQIKILKNTIAKTLNDSEFMFFAEVCKATGLNPLLREIHATIHKDRTTGERNLTLITGIDGFRKTAHKTGLYAGRDKAKFEYKEGANEPHSVEVTVYKMVQGVRCPFTATAVRDEYLPNQPKKRFMWNKMKEWMLEKCCEAKALRMAFTQELSGIYEEGEAHQIGETPPPPSEGKSMNQLIKGLPEAKQPEEGEIIEDVEHEEVVPVGEPEEEPPADENQDEEAEEEPAQVVDHDRLLTVEERQGIFRVSRARRWKDEQVRTFIRSFTGVKTTDQMTVGMRDAVLAVIRKNTAEEMLSAANE